jgi:hypothetical protein
MSTCQLLVAHIVDDAAKKRLEQLSDATVADAETWNW